MKNVAIIIFDISMIFSGNAYGDIAFVANVEGNWNLFCTDDNGRNPIQLTTTPYDEKTPSWSPDQKNIVYATSDGHINIINAISKKTSQIAGEQNNTLSKVTPSFSPNSKKIAFSQFRPFSQEMKDDTDLMIFNLETKTHRKVLNQWAIQMWPAWSPDASRLVYASNHCSSDCGRIIQELWIADPNGGWARQLLMTNSLCQQPDWSPDRKHITFSSDKSDNFDIWTVSLEDWKLKQITTHESLDASPSWSPDGNKIAFVSTRSGIMEIWIKDLKKDELKKLRPFGDKNIECKDVAW